MPPAKTKAGLEIHQDRPLTPIKPKAEERYIRIKNVTRDEDQFPAYQTEVIEVVDDTIVSRRLIGVPDLFEYAYSQAGLLVDPRIDHDE